MMVLVLISNDMHAAEYVEVNAREGVTQSFLWMPHDRPIATVILFAGGGGKIKLDATGEIGRQGNFLIRSRDLFSQHGMNVAVVDAPSDQYGRGGMKGGFRATLAHAEDVQGVIEKVRLRSLVPVWLVGTSRGTESVANAGVRLQGQYAGLVFTSSITVNTDNGASILERDLAKITAPVMIASHEEDGCFVTPPSDSEFLKQAFSQSGRVVLKMYQGGDEAVSAPCKAKSEHGFYGIEGRVVADIAEFIISTLQE